MVKSTPKSAFHLEDLLQQMDKDAKIPFQGFLLHTRNASQAGRRLSGSLLRLCLISKRFRFCSRASACVSALPVHHTEYYLHDLQQGRRMSSATSTTCCTTLAHVEHGISNLRYIGLKPSTNSSTYVTCPVPSITASTSSARRIASTASTTCYMPSSTWSITSGTAPHAACPPAFLAYGARPQAPPAYTL